MIPTTENESDLLQDWAIELGCSEEELRSAMGEAGRICFERSAAEQFELDLGAPA